ncbi:Uu.00g039480.m01.CDS01 [Anthostomella pinea]|uniref:Uu.00g039480.m01.CDS01 n=1 Tax=Anthostomella pinea TaxID=933095 RepID=A0AAI8VA08_9PEZI|nr:Uu.00g039480.m01.CDS01 [Anthostomella pinea]
MADPFSVATGILGVVGLTMQIAELLMKYALSITYTNIMSPDFSKAMEGNNSALLAHFRPEGSAPGKRIDHMVTTVPPDSENYSPT